MTQMHPITGAVIGSTAAQRAQADEKAAHMRRAEQNRKNIPATDTFEQRIQSPDELDAVGEDRPKQSGRRNRRNSRQSKPAPPADDDQHNLDVTA